MRPKRFAFVCCAWMLLVLPRADFAQTSEAPANQDVGSLAVHTERTAWPSPESVAAGLRSSDDQDRIKALVLLGLSEDQDKITVWDQKSGKPLPEKQVLPVDIVQLFYAALGSDDTRAAVLAVAASQMTYAAVAIPSDKGWTRIATFDCWCKYDMNGPRDVLSEFVQLHYFFERGGLPNPQHYELVLRASGGGSGIYVQDEAHYRIRHGELRLVMSFTS